MAGCIFYPLGDWEHYARAHLGCEMQEGKNLVVYDGKVGVEDTRELGSLLSLDRGRQVILFRHAEDMTPNAQNALLKALEDRDDILFIFMSTKLLLPTVESRSTIIRSETKSLREFLQDNPVAYGEVWYYLAGAVMPDDDVSKIVRIIGESNILQLISDKYLLLTVFGQMKEKGGNNFFEKHRDLVRGVFDVFEHLLMKVIDDDRAVQALAVIEEHKEMERRNSSYGKNDFFDFLVSV